jgi:hypothetical protein
LAELGVELASVASALDFSLQLSKVTRGDNSELAA